MIDEIKSRFGSLKSLNDMIRAKETEYNQAKARHDMLSSELAKVEEELVSTYGSNWRDKYAEMLNLLA